MTDKECRDLQEFRKLWSRLNASSMEQAMERTAEMLAEQIAREAAEG